MEKTLQEGSASWGNLLTVKHLGLGLLTGGIWLIVPAAQIVSNKFKLTTERIFLTKGMISKQRKEIDLHTIREINFEQGAAQRALGIGNVIIESRAEKIVLEGVKDPEDLKEKIRSASKTAKKEQGVTYRDQV